MRRRDETQDRADGGITQFGALGEGAAVVLAALAQQQLYAFEAQPVEFVDGAQDAHLLAGVGDTLAGQQAVQQFTVIDAQLRRNAGGLEPGDSQGDHFGVGFRAIGTDGVGVTLDEFAQTAGARLFIAIDGAESVAAERLGQGFPVLRSETGQRRRQVVTQGHPLFIVVLEREDADIGAVGIGQELAKRIGIFEGRGLQGFEAEVLIDLGHGVDQPAFNSDLTGALIGKAARASGFGTESSFWIFAHAPRLDYWTRRDKRLLMFGTSPYSRDRRIRKQVVF